MAHVVIGNGSYKVTPAALSQAAEEYVDVLRDGGYLWEYVIERALGYNPANLTNPEDAPIGDREMCERYRQMTIGSLLIILSDFNS